MDKVIICGDRHWTDYKLILSVIEGFNNSTLVIVGGATGADTLAGFAAESQGYFVEVHPANWLKYGKAAGPIRNQEMLDRNPDYVIAFHDDIENSKGTKDMITRAKKAGVEVRLVTHSNYGSRY